MVSPSRRPTVSASKGIVPEKWTMVNPSHKLSIFERLRWMYFQWGLASCTFMLDPWERRLSDVFFLSIFGIIGYSCYAYLPAYLLHLWKIFLLLIFPWHSPEKAEGAREAVHGDISGTPAGGA